eukprot:9467446-Pyramimonas_sp.AAC.1
MKRARTEPEGGSPPLADPSSSSSLPSPPPPPPPLPRGPGEPEGREVTARAGSPRRPVTDLVREIEAGHPRQRSRSPQDRRSFFLLPGGGEGGVQAVPAQDLE